MRVLVLAVGRMKKGAEADLADRYLKRAAQAGRAIGIRSIEIVEIRESRAPDAERRRLEESIAIANVVPEGAIVVLLDERGESFGSAAFADQLGRWRDAGQAVTAFVIGGADGLSDTLRDKARITLNFGKATWPHQLVRIMLLEQLYRAVTILSGHPYHRE
jgi:23S rRNA (pseudouridine1915-N3)-methyltransferase